MSAGHVLGSLVQVPEGLMDAQDQHTLGCALPPGLHCEQSATHTPFEPTTPGENGQSNVPVAQPAQDRTVHVSPQHAPPQLRALHSGSASPPSNEASASAASLGPTSTVTSFGASAASAGPPIPDPVPLPGKPHATKRIAPPTGKPRPATSHAVRRSPTVPMIRSLLEARKTPDSHDKSPAATMTHIAAATKANARSTTAMSPQSHAKVPEHVQTRTFDGDLVILDLAQGEYFALDPVGARMWQGLAAGHAAREIAADVARHYEVAVDRALSDLLALVAQLVSRGLLIVEEAGEP